MCVFWQFVCCQFTSSVPFFILHICCLLTLHETGSAHAFSAFLLTFLLVFTQDVVRGKTESVCIRSGEFNSKRRWFGCGLADVVCQKHTDTANQFSYLIFTKPKNDISAHAQLTDAQMRHDVRSYGFSHGNISFLRSRVLSIFNKLHNIFGSLLSCHFGRTDRL